MKTSLFLSFRPVFDIRKRAPEDLGQFVQQLMYELEFMGLHDAGFEWACEGNHVWVQAVADTADPNVQRRMITLLSEYAALLTYGIVHKKGLSWAFIGHGEARIATRPTSIAQGVGVFVANALSRLATHPTDVWADDCDPLVVQAWSGLNSLREWNLRPPVHASAIEDSAFYLLHEIRMLEILKGACRNNPGYRRTWDIYTRRYEPTITFLVENQFEPKAICADYDWDAWSNGEFSLG